MTRPIGGTGLAPSTLLRSGGTPPPAPKPAPEAAASRSTDTRYQSGFEPAGAGRPKPALDLSGQGQVRADDAATLEKDPKFQKLDAEVRKTLAQQLALHPKGSDARKTLTALATAPGFQGMSTADQQKLLRYVGGTNRDLSVPARKLMAAQLGQDDFKKADAAGQTEQLQTFLAGQKATPRVVSPEKDAFKNQRLPYKLHGPSDVKDYAFNSGNAPAVKYEVEVDGKKLPVYLPKKLDKATTPGIDEVAKGLAALPASSRALVKEVSVEGKANPQDAYWAQAYNDPTFSSYMTAGADGVINIYPAKPKPTQDYLEGTMVHETGHTLSIQKWGEDTDAKAWDDWRAAIQSDGIVPSQYAKASMDEDFGEALQLYRQVKGTTKEAEVRALMPERFKIIDELLSGKR